MQPRFFGGRVGQQEGYKSAFGTSTIFSNREHQAGFERIFARWRYPMETLWQDCQFAVRMMRKNLGFTAAAVLCLMLGIGATTGIFTVVNAVLLRPLPYSHPEQPVRVTAADVSGGMLETLGVAPIAGRLISASDDVPGAPVVADISYGTWR